jgi:hypothetical protein
MAETRTRIIFAAKPMKIGPEWQVRAEWVPSGQTEYISGFRTEAEAEAWINGNEGKAWKRKRGYPDD